MANKTLLSPFTLVGKDEQGVGVLRPIIPIEICYYKNGRPDATSRKFALIDSGADRCIFRGEIGDELGIDVKSGNEWNFGGVANGKELKGYTHKVGIEVGQFNIYTAEVVFTYDLSSIADVLLGQYGFFNKFSIKLDQRKNEIIIKDR